MSGIAGIVCVNGEPDQDDILSSSQNPEISGFDDTKIICDGIAQFRPVSRHLLAQKSERCVGELGAGGVAFVVGDVFVHDAPQALDRVEVRTIGRDEMQFDPTTRTFKLGAHKPGVMIARVVEKHMTERERRIHRLD
jgi:hypothetical protein